MGEARNDDYDQVLRYYVYWYYVSSCCLPEGRGPHEKLVHRHCGSPHVGRSPVGRVVQLLWREVGLDVPKAKPKYTNMHGCRSGQYTGENRAL